MNSVNPDQKNKIQQYFKEAFNRELSDAEVEEIHQSLFYLGRAIARFERRKHERNGN